MHAWHVQVFYKILTGGPSVVRGNYLWQPCLVRCGHLWYSHTRSEGTDDGGTIDGMTDQVTKPMDVFSTITQRLRDCVCIATVTVN